MALKFFRSVQGPDQGQNQPSQTVDPQMRSWRFLIVAHLNHNQELLHQL